MRFLKQNIGSLNSSLWKVFWNVQCQCGSTTVLFGCHHPLCNLRVSNRTCHIVRPDEKTLILPNFLLVFEGNCCDGMGWNMNTFLDYDTFRFDVLHPLFIFSFYSCVAGCHRWSLGGVWQKGCVHIHRGGKDITCSLDILRLVTLTEIITLWQGSWLRTRGMLLEWRERRLGRFGKFCWAFRTLLHWMSWRTLLRLSCANIDTHNASQTNKWTGIDIFMLTTANLGWLVEESGSHLLFPLLWGKKNHTKKKTVLFHLL